jgi:hypothetical protein
LIESPLRRAFAIYGALRCPRFSTAPAAPDSQLVLELFDEAPDGTLTLFSRGVLGLRSAVPGIERTVRVDGNASRLPLRPAPAR